MRWQLLVKVKEDMTGWIMSEHGVADSKITVIEQVDDYITPKGKHVAQWLVECNCENHTRFITTGQSLKSGHTKTCGCSNMQRLVQMWENNKKYNKYDITGEYGVGWTTNTNREFYFDLEDYDKIKNYCWYEGQLSHTYHTIETRINNKIVRMHQIIYGKNVDHKNRNTLDNRKENLRYCTTQENSWNSSVRSDNTSGYIGVSWDKENNKWAARIEINKKPKRLGRFMNKEDAIKARLEAEAKYFKEFAPQQHLFEEYGIDIEV